MSGKLNLSKHQRETLAAVQSDSPGYEIIELRGTELWIGHPEYGSFPIHGTPRNPGAAKQRAVQRARAKTRMATSNVGRLLHDMRVAYGVAEDESRDVKLNLNEYVREWVGQNGMANKVSTKSLQVQAAAELQMIQRGRGPKGSVWRIVGPDYDPEAKPEKNGNGEREYDLPAMDDTAILKLMEEDPSLINDRVTAHYHAKHGGAEGLVEEVDKLRNLIGMTQMRVAQYLAIDPARVKSAYTLLEKHDLEVEREQALAEAKAVVNGQQSEPEPEPQAVEPVIEPEPKPKPEKPKPKPKPEPVAQPSGLTLPPEIVEVLRAQLVGDMDEKLAEAVARAEQAEERLSYAVEQLRAFEAALAEPLANLTKIHADIGDTVEMVTTV